MTPIQVQVGVSEGLTWGPFLQTLPHSTLNSKQMSSFTIEFSFYVTRLSEQDQGEVCMLDRPSPKSAAAISSGSSAPSSRDCPSLRVILTPSNRVLVIWSSSTNATSATDSVWKLAGK